MNFSTFPHASQLQQNGLLAAACLEPDFDDTCIRKLPLPKSQKLQTKLSSLELLEQYTQSRKQFKRSSMKCILQDQQVISTALKLLPFDDLNEIDREAAEWIRNMLHHYPKNARKHQIFNGLDGLDIVSKNSRYNYPTLSNSSVKGIIEKVSTFCNWAVSHGHIETNYFYCLPTHPPKHEDKRQAFSNDHLNAIFHMDSYLDHQYLHSYYYWLPLLLRFTGCRLNELCQLHKVDITTKGKIPCISVHDSFDGQRIKNSSSKRSIPLHSELVRLGFLSFVATLQTERVFPELKLVNGYYSHNASKWFARRRDKLGLTKGLDAHSFRHTFVNELKQNLVPREVIEGIVGHEQQSDSFNVYSKHYEVDVLQSFIEQISPEHTKHIKPYFS
ncbi:site-specific integrase [Vibrio superstes]|uniref:Tyr recombinase domain-containing protein n=1 Tax=Vibrio superstes NBRC 103154 TaxID=1219062 RepID=A0A511QN40_9VIBR|nr:site-specific integrase [Vibrio superstes]GEM78739.1 hypothetical protein VSU01S_09840 [Vibrio superstes NBRC 103154]